MTLQWTNAVTFTGTPSQTDSGCVYNFSESNYVDIYFSPTATEVVWVIPFTSGGTAFGREPVLGHGEQDWFFPYKASGSATLQVYNGSVYTLFTPETNVKYWVRITRNYTAKTVKYEYSTDGVTYTNIRTINWNENPSSWSGYIRLGNSVYTNELNRWWYGAIFLSEVKVTVDGVDLPLYNNIQDKEFVDDITITGQPVITQSGCVAGFKPDTHIELAMTEITGANPSSTLTYIVPMVRTSRCSTNREAQMGWKAERWFLPKFINNSDDALYAYNNTTGRNVQVSPTLTLYQKYWIKIDWTEGTGTRTYSYSTDGENFTQFTSFNDTSMASATPSGVTFLGMGNANSSETAQWFTGDIYLADMKIIANGEEIPILKEIKPETAVAIFNFNKPLVIGGSIKLKTAPFKFYEGKNMSLISLKAD